MPGWQQVDTDNLNRPRTTKIRGVEVTVFFGPDDMPLFIRGDYDQALKKFVIRFRYDSAPEATKRVKLDEHIFLAAGQESERLHEVELDVDAMDVEVVRFIGNALKELPDRASKVGLNRIDNYVAASKAFNQISGGLEKTVAH